MTFQISRRLVWKLHQPIPSGLWGVSHQVPQTSVYSGSSGGYKHDDLLQFEALFSPSPCLAVYPLERCGRRGCQQRLKQKHVEYLSLLLCRCYQFASLFSSVGYTVFDLFFWLIYLYKPFLLLLASLAKRPSTLPRMPVSASTAFAVSSCYLV